MIVYALLGLAIGALLNIASDYLPKQLARESCNAPIQLRRAIIELATAILFAYLWHRYGLSLRLVLLSLYTCVLLLVLIIDLEHRLVLNAVILPAIILVLLANLIYPNPGLRNALLGGAIGFGFFYLISLAWREAMGAGDIKLAALIGLMTGFPQVIVALTVGISVGGLVALLLLLTGVKDRKGYIPYAPFLTIGGMAALLWGR